MDWFGFGEVINLKRYDGYRIFSKHDISNIEAFFVPKDAAVLDKYVPILKH